MGKLANKVAYELLDANNSEGAAQLIWCVYTGLESWKNRIRRKLYGTELMDEYVANYLWTEWRDCCADKQKLTIYQIRTISRGLVWKFEQEIAAECPIRERLLDIVAVVVKFCFNITKQSGE